ncbi:MAG: class I SAM-dependent methyltransferase [Candidatus Woesearchaeota archaeon]
MALTKESTIESIDRQAMGITGFSSALEGRILYYLAKKYSKKGVIVEIGSAYGRSTIWIAAGSQAGANTAVYAIDPHRNFLDMCSENHNNHTLSHFRHNMKRLKMTRIVVPIIKRSADASKTFNTPIGMLFIDGDYQYTAVKQDFELWFPKVVDGGIIALHDTLGTLSGPKRVAREKIYFSTKFKDVNFIDRTTYATKTKKNSWKDRIRNRYIFFWKCIYDYTHQYTSQDGA